MLQKQHQQNKRFPFFFFFSFFLSTFLFSLIYFLLTFIFSLSLFFLFIFYFFFSFIYFFLFFYPSFFFSFFLLFSSSPSTVATHKRATFTPHSTRRFEDRPVQPPTGTAERRSSGYLLHQQPTTTARLQSALGRRF